MKTRKTMFPVVVSFRLTEKEKEQLDIMSCIMDSTKSEFLRDGFKRIIRTKNNVSRCEY